MELWIGALNLGFLYAFMAMGVFITFRIHDFADITVDGSFVAGAAIASVILISGGNPILALTAAFFIGSMAGVATAVIHTRLGVNGLLAGILVMTGLYSINLHIMQRSNIPLLNQRTLFSKIAEWNPGLPGEVWTAIALFCLGVVFWQLVSLFFKTDLGIAMRATGNNEIMAAASGRNVEFIKIFGIALANGFVGISGALVAQYQGFADIGMGIGTLLVGLASVILGESILKKRSIYIKVLSVIMGSVLFRLMIAVALFFGMNPIDLKLLTALFVLLTLILSKVYSSRNKASSSQSWRLSTLFASPKFRMAAVSSFVLIGLVSIMIIFITPPKDKKHIKIGLAQVTDHALLNITRDSFIAEMDRIGYIEGKNCTIIRECANGDLSVVNSIIDKFLLDDVNLVLTISTPVTQAAVNKVKDRPVVFATVANPFIIGAGTSDDEHLPNVTGVYGWVPMDKTLQLTEEILGEQLRIGSIWDPAQANAVFNVEQLKKAVAAKPRHQFIGVTVYGSSEVYQAALSLINRDIDVFILPPDNIVYSAFESIVKVAAANDIPIFMSDVERLGDGALGTLGYDYTSSGIQAAHIVDRVLKGEDPAKIPFERYSNLTIGINLKVANAANIEIPDSVLNSVSIVIDRQLHKTPHNKNNSTETKRLVLFQFSDHSIINETANGVLDELEHTGILKEKNIVIERKNAQNEFTLGQSIAQDIVHRNYDYIVTLSTPALQIMAQANKTIPHVFGCVTDPYRMGVAQDSTNHIPHITGVATMQPVEQSIRIMRELFPEARRLGLVWNPSEACSEACTFKARDAAEKYGFTLVENTVASTTDVMDALNAVISRDVDLFLTSGDNTVLMAIESIGEVLRKKKIPYFTNGPGDIERGAMFAIGADYYDVGRATGQMAIRVINGEDSADIPIQDCVPVQIGVNLLLVNEMGISIPADFIERAKMVKR